MNVSIPNKLTEPVPLAERAALSVREFCSLHGFSRSSFYNLCATGKGPRLLKVGARTLVTRESATAWRRRMENAS